MNLLEMIESGRCPPPVGSTVGINSNARQVQAGKIPLGAEATIKEYEVHILYEGREIRLTAKSIEAM